MRNVSAFNSEPLSIANSSIPHGRSRGIYPLSIVNSSIPHGRP